jgi:TRAP-type C4-dicarboxylate transport system permease small subunit
LNLELGTMNGGREVEQTGNTGEGRTERSSGIAHRLCLATGRLADISGHLAAVTLLVLTFSIVLGIALRVVSIDNSWTYDVDLYALIWLTFFGAALTSLRNHHVTAGIALEKIFGRGKLLRLLRFAAVVAFMVIFAVSGYRLTHTSFVTHETTLDVMEWPVWIAEAALPIGTALWLFAEVHKLLRPFCGDRQGSESRERPGSSPVAGTEEESPIILSGGE